MAKIREAVLSDLGSIAKIHVDAWNTTYKGIVPEEHLAGRTYKGQEEKWKKRYFENPNTNEVVFVAENNEGQVVGFASVSNKNEDDKFDGIVSTLYILKDYQGRGIGKQLFYASVNKLKELNARNLIIWVFAENKSRGFYEKMGGKLVKEQWVNIGNKDILEVAYGWDDIKKYLF